MINSPGKREMKELQKTITFGTENKLREVLMWKCRTYFISRKILHIAQIENTEELQQYIP